MTSRPCAAALGLALALTSAPSRADSAPAAQPQTFRLFVDPSLSAIDAEALRRAVADELKADVQLTATRPDRDGLAVVAGDGRAATVTFHGADRVTERTVELPADRTAAVDTVAWLAGNVARDEASELVAELSHRPEPVATVTAAPTARAPVVIGSQKRAPAPGASREAPCRRPLDRPVGVELVPYLGTSTLWGNDGVQAASIGAVAALARGTRGVQVAGLAALESEFVCGAQVGGGIAVTAGEVVGAQVAGAVNVTEGLEGGQVSAVNVASGHALGGQIGVVNVSGSTTGAQVGVVNVAVGRVRGAQVGLFNYADDSDASIGLISIVRKGRTQIDARGSEWGVVAATLEHGGRFLHGSLGMAARLTGDARRGAVVAGIGSHFQLSERFWIAPDLRGYFFALGEGAAPKVVELAIPIGLQLHRAVAVYAGPTYRMGFLDTDEPFDVGPFEHRPVHEHGSLQVRGAPGAVVGLRGL